jgi:DNA gyrase subunit B
VACPPLYKVTTGRQAHAAENAKYFFDQQSYEAYLSELPMQTTTQTQRYKGLGEMMPNQLWDTTMNPETRILKQVKIADVTECEATFAMLMGDTVGPRKQFITDNMKSFTV